MTAFFFCRKCTRCSARCRKRGGSVASQADRLAAVPVYEEMKESTRFCSEYQPSPGLFRHHRFRPLKEYVSSTREKNVCFSQVLQNAIQLEKSDLDLTHFSFFESMSEDWVMAKFRFSLFSQKYEQLLLLQTCFIPSDILRVYKRSIYFKQKNICFSTHLLRPTELLNLLPDDNDAFFPLPPKLSPSRFPLFRTSLLLLLLSFRSSVL